MKLTVLIPRTENDKRVAEILKRYVSTGLMRPFILYELSDRGVWIDQSEDPEYSSLSNLISEIDGCDLIRYICYSATDEEVDSDYLTDVAEIRRSMSSPDFETVFGSVYSCQSDERLPYGLFGAHNRYFDYNLVVVPEDSLGETNSPTVSIDSASRVDEVVANALGIVGGLWWWLDESPLDSAQHAGEGDLQRVRLTRATCRMVKSKDLVTEAVHNVLSGDGKRLLPRECVAHGQPERAINELHSVLAPPGKVSPIGFSYRHFPSPAPPAKERLGIIQALKLFGAELVVEIRTVLTAIPQMLKASVRRRLRRIEEGVGRVVTDQTFGTESAIIVGVKDTTDVGLIMDQAMRCRELDQLPDLGNFRAVGTPKVWRTLTTAIISAADGGEIPEALKSRDGLEWHEQRAVIEELDLLVPDLRSEIGDSMIRPHDVQTIRAILSAADEANGND